MCLQSSIRVTSHGARRHSERIAPSVVASRNTWRGKMSIHSGTRTVSDSNAQSYEVLGWRRQFEILRSGLVKQISYATLWPLIHAEARRWLSAETLGALQPAGVLR